MKIVTFFVVLCLLQMSSMTAGYTGVKLHVEYLTRYFIPILNRPEVQGSSYYIVSGRNHVKVYFRQLRPGWSSFEEVRDALQPIFPKRIIKKIGQLRGTMKWGRPVAEVTIRAGKGFPEDSDWRIFRNIDGRKVKQFEDRPQWCEMQEGGRIFIPGGRGRTVIEIWPW